MYLLGEWARAHFDEIEGNRWRYDGLLEVRA